MSKVVLATAKSTKERISEDTSSSPLFIESQAGRDRKTLPDEGGTQPVSWLLGELAQHGEACSLLPTLPKLWRDQRSTNTQGRGLCSMAELALAMEVTHTSAITP